MIKHHIFYGAFLLIIKRCSIKGVICRIEGQSFFLYDELSEDLIRCSLRGRFKKEFQLKKDKLYQRDIAVVGDKVDYDKNSDGSGVITKIDERRNYISRKSPKQKGASFRGERLEQIIASNIDNFFIIASTSAPDFNNKVVDRFLVIGESSKLGSITIVLNKSDLRFDEEMEYYYNLYSSIGYSVVVTSTKQNKGIEEIREKMNGKINLLWGQSGVGKSSILNSVYPHLNFKVAEVSSFNFKGKHTTVTSTMIKAAHNTYITDTPGIREIDPFGIRKEDLCHYFAEFSGFLSDCRFNTCTHNHEPGCGIMNAVENGNISAERYDSYLRLLETVEDDIVF